MYKLYFKPAIDMGLSIFLAILSFPVILILCVVVCLDTPGFPIFRHRRVGKNKKLFHVFKLRTMYKDAVGSFSTKQNDKRITKFGKFLRRYSLDELPQIWNIILGQMSFIGPRPSSSLEKERYSKEEWDKRHLLKPGITGLAQSTKRSNCTIEERIAFDLEYINNCSLSLDIKILWKTILIVIKGDGVN